LPGRAIPAKEQQKEYSGNTPFLTGAAQPFFSMVLCRITIVNYNL